MYVIRMAGGLGNQLFCYAFYLRMRSQFPLENVNINYDNYKYCKFHNGLRIAEVFDLSYPFAIKDQYSFCSRLRYKVRSVIERITINMKNVPIIHEDLDEFNEFIKKPIECSTVLFNGTWGSEKYFNSVKEEVKTTYSHYKIKFSDKVRDLAKRMQTQNAVFMHVRRGDYLQTDFVDLSLTDYYQNALEFIKKKSKKINLTIYIISDDPEYCQKHFMFLKGENIIFLHGNQDYEDLFLMSNCKYAIIANSSFSWWGAYLSNAEIVCAPKERLKSRADRPHEVLYPKEWNVI